MQELNEYFDRRRRDARTEKELMSAVRKLSQEDRYSVLLPYFRNSTVALLFAQKVGLKQSHYKQMWLIGLDCSNVSSIKFWISAIAPNLGWRKLFQLIEKEIIEGNPKASWAIYHIPYLFRDLVPTIEEREIFISIVKKAWNSKILDFNPAQVWGGQWGA
jgi:hypothetical protein